MKDKETPTIEDALKSLRKQYGEGAVLYEDQLPEKVETVPSGSFALDYVLGYGLPRGRIIEVFGQESSGKSTLCSFILAQVQKRGGKCVYIDAEQAFDADYAGKLGVDTKKLYLAQVGTLEEAMDTVKAFVVTNEIDLIIIDSVAALTPKSEAEGEEMLKETMGVQARLLGKALRILSPLIGKSRTIVIFINQTRDKIGIVYGNPETTPGGKALKFFSSVRLNVRKGEKYLGKGDEQIGNEITITAVKNKVAPPFRKRAIGLYYGTGIDLVADTFDEAVIREVINKTGNTYEYDGNKIGVGRDQAISVLKGSDDLYQKVREVLTTVITAKPDETTAGEPPKQAKARSKS